jgi:hypothetical protein
MVSVHSGNMLPGVALGRNSPTGMFSGTGHADLNHALP